MAISEIIDLKAQRNAQQEAEPWILIGKIRKTVGLHGWLRIGLLTDYLERFEPGKEIYIQRNSNSTPEAIMVDDWRDHYSETAIEIRFEGVEDVDVASVFVGAMIVIPKSEREPIENDSEFYPDELEGMSILAPEGNAVGVVLKLEAEAPCPYLVIKTDLNVSTEVMIPFLKQFIEGVDRANRTVKLVEPISFHMPVE